MDEIIARHSSYIIPNYTEETASDRLTGDLSIFKKRTFTRKTIGVSYNENTHELRIPRGYSFKKLGYLLNRDIIIDENPNKADKIVIKLKTKPRDEKQFTTIKFLCGLGDTFKYTRKYSQLFSDLKTGTGKTYCAIVSIAYFGEKAIIFTPRMISKLNTQWLDSFLFHSDISKDQILIVQGSKMCQDIIADRYNNIDIFIISRATALSFATKFGWERFELLMKKTRAGIKIVDEVHLDFETNMLIDCYSNIKRNWYLTSSAGRGDRIENKIFKRLFHDIPILGSELTTMRDNYIIMVIYKFHHKPTTEQRLACKTKDGLSQSLYSTYLTSRDGARNQFFNALHKAIISVYCKYKVDTGKLLILGSTRELLKTISKFLQVNFPQFSTGLYTSDISNKAERELELTKDIILATDKGLGTGPDLKDLQVMINVIPYSNWISADQLPGRLRKNGDVFYIELVNADFPEAISQFNNRAGYLCTKAKGGRLIMSNVD